MITWLPDWRSFTKPSRSSARTTAAPETRGNLGMGGNAERCYQRVSLNLDGKLGQIEGCGLLKIGNRLFDGFTLRSSARLWIQRNEAALFGGSKYCGQFHGRCSNWESRIVAHSVVVVLKVAIHQRP